MGANCSTCRVAGKEKEMILYIESPDQQTEYRAKGQEADIGGEKSKAAGVSILAIPITEEMEPKIVKLQAQIKSFLLREEMKRNGLLTREDQIAVEGTFNQIHTQNTCNTREEDEFPQNVVSNEDRLQDESQIILEYIQRKAKELGISREGAFNIENTVLSIQNILNSQVTNSMTSPRMRPFEIETREIEILNDNLSKYAHTDKFETRTEKTDQSVDLVNYCFTQEKLAQSCESFFIRNSYENSNLRPHSHVNPLGIYIREDQDYSNADVNPFKTNPNNEDDNSSVNKSRKVIKTIRKVIRTPISKSSIKPENIKLEIKKTMLLFNLVSKKYQKFCILLLKNFFRLWKYHAKINLFRSQSINKQKHSKNQFIKRLVKKMALKYIQVSFYKWFKTALKLKNRIKVGGAILRKILIFKEKSSINNYFKNWLHNAKILSEQSNHFKLKESLFCKIMNTFFNRNLNSIVSRRFKHWKEFSFKIKDDMIVTLGLMKLSKILKILNNRILIDSLREAYENDKKEKIKSKSLIGFYYQKQMGDLRVLRKIFLKWVNGGENKRKSNPIEQLNILFKTFGKLNKIMDKIQCRRFFKNVVRKADWEKPTHRNRKNSLKYVKYYLNNGTEVELDKVSIVKNYLWKYSKPLNYYFKRLQVIANKLKHKEFESKSKKWQIKEKI